MPATRPLDLATLDPAVWRILAGGEARGPCTLGQVKALIEGGHLQPGTPVAHGHGAPFRPAIEYPALFGDGDSGAPRNYLLVLPEGADEPMMRRLGELGACLEASPGIFIIRARLAIGEMRAAIAPLADGHMVLVDASANRLAWAGLDPQTDRAVRGLWRQHPARDRASHPEGVATDPFGS